jgi:hypothetical protein
MFKSFGNNVTNGGFLECWDAQYLPGCEGRVIDRGVIRSKRFFDRMPSAAPTMSVFFANRNVAIHLKKSAISV